MIEGMFGSVFSRTQVAGALAVTVVVTAGAVALGHGSSVSAVVVPLLMVNGFLIIARGRELVALGRPDHLGSARDWLVALHFALVALFLLTSPQL